MNSDTQSSLPRFPVDALASESLLRAITDSAQDAILMMDPDGNVSHWNPAAVRILGYARAEAIGQNLHDLIAPTRFHHAHHAAFPVFQQTGRGAAVDKTVDLEARRKDGKEISVQLSLSTIQMNGGWHAVGILRDTTERKEAEKALRALSSRQEAILAAIPDILMEVDNRKVYTWANQAGLAFFGDDVIGKEAACFFEGEQPTYQSVQPLFNGQQDVISLESWQRRKDGEKRLLAWRCRVLKDADGNVTGALSSARDITERVLAEEELRFKNAQLSTQQEASIDGILMVDENARILSYNRRFVEMWGLPAKLVEDKVDEPVLQFVTAQVLDSRPFPQRIQYLYEYSLEISRDELVLVDGRFFDLYSAPMLGPDEHYYGRVWYFRDITERMRADESEERALLRQQGISQLQQLLLTPIALEDRLRNVTDVIVRLFDVDFCRIWLIRPGDLCERDCLHAEVREGPHVCRDRDRCLHLVSSSGRYSHIDGRGHRRVPFGCYKIGRVAAEEEHKFVTNDVQNDPLVHDRVWAHDLGLVSFAGYQLRAPGGEPLGVLALFAKHPILADEDAILDGLGSTVALVVQRAVAETALRRSETKFRTLYDSSGDAVMLLNAKGFFDCNQAALAIFGCATREEFCSKHPADMSPPTQPDGTVSLILANQHIAVALEKGSNHFEWIHQRADTGETFPADVMLTAMELDGRPVLQALVRNVTERKRLEDQLRQLSRAMEQSPASIVITDDAGAIEYVNPKFVEITGYTLAEARGENPRILKSGDSGPEVYRELWRTITSGKVWRGEFHNKKKSGELYWESASISAIRDLAGRITHFVAVKEDITARKLTETERTLLIQRLQDALANVKALSGLLPICAGCKKIRDDQGYWNQVESYVQQHSEATFTHGMCPECIKKFFPGISKPASTPDEDTRR